MRGRRRDKAALPKGVRVLRARSSDPDTRLGTTLYPEQPGVDYHRPKTRAECAGVGGPGAPCAFASCKWHLAVDVNRYGTIKFSHPGVDILDLPWTCGLAMIEQYPDGVPPPILAEAMGTTKGYVMAIMADARKRVHLPVIDALR